MTDDGALEIDRKVARGLVRCWPAFFERFGRLTDTQRKAIPPILAGRHVLLSAPTASGKTEAACAPMLERILGAPERKTLLYVCPTRALVNDLYERLCGPAERLDLSVARRTGDHSIRNDRVPELLITTPESFDSMICRGRHGEQGHLLAWVAGVVLDEVHVLYGTPRGEQLRWLLERLRRLRKQALRKKWSCDDSVQVVALSATIADETGMSDCFLRDGQVVSVRGARRIETVAARSARLTAEWAVFDYVRKAAAGEKVLVFCNSRKRVDDLSAILRQRLAELNYEVHAHHGSLSKERRESAESKARERRRIVLVATSTLELGIDIGDIDLVVLDAPAPDMPALLQRMGRGNRRTGVTRVMACAGSLDEVIIHSAMIEAAREGWVTGEDTARNPRGTWLREPDNPKSEPRTFDCKTVPHITLKSIAQNVALDPIFARHQPILDKALADGNAALAKVSDAQRAKLCAKLASKAAGEGVRAISDADARRWLLPGTTPKALRSAIEDAFAGAKRNLTPSQKRSCEERIPARAEVGPSSVPENGVGWEHWQVPFDTDPDWPSVLRDAVTAYRKAWRAKMDEVNACIAASAEQEELVDQPRVERGVTRVSGPFTVEAVQPPELSLEDNIDPRTAGEGMFDGAPEELPEGFEPRSLRMVEARNELEVANVGAYLEQMFRYLKADGVRFLNNKQARWTRFEPLFEASRAELFHAEGRWIAGDGEDEDPEGPNNVVVVFGPQYGPVTAKLVEQATRAAIRRGYQHLLVAGFSFDGAATGVLSEANEPGIVYGPSGHRLHVHFAHIRPDINPGMNGLLKESPQPGAGQLFSVFGLPRVRIDRQESPDGRTEYVVEMEGVDIYNPVDNSISSTGADKVAAWFLDGDFDGRTFCVTQAFFPDRSAWEKLSRALNGKDGPIDADRFEAFSGTRSLPFPAGKNECVAVKVIDPRGNEVMTVERLIE